MAWIKHGDVHINMELVRSFWWERKDTHNAYLYLTSWNGEIATFDDPYQSLYWKACNATKQQMTTG